MPTKLFVIVHSGSPVDFAKYRHTALFCEFRDGTSALLHVTGVQGEFQFEERTTYNPETSQTIVRKILVADIPDSVNAGSIRSVISTTPVKNGASYGDWNCQNYVGDALARLVTYRYLGASERAAAIDEMTDAILEAEDE
ncbi:hypothetical protein BJX99DRAFT_261113 [Aspergillus californicus]